ncbi:MAG: restriction endonuclease subunit S [Akkermansia sp.]
MDKKANKPSIRFAGFTDAWEWRKLSMICSMHARIGWQNLRTSEFLDSGDYYLITGTDFNNGRVNFDSCHYVDKSRYNQDAKIQIQNGSILITKDGTLGKVAFVEGLDKPATLNAGIFNVEITKDFVDKKYLFQYLKAPFLMDYVDKKATGGTIKHLNQNILVDFPIFMSGVEEQRLIGVYFEQLDNLMILHQRKYDKLVNLKKSMLEQMFPQHGTNAPEIRFSGFTDAWVQYKFGEIAFVAMNKRIFKSQTSQKGDVPFYKIGTFGATPDSYISRELFEEYRAKYPYPKVGDILISASGSIGKTVEYKGKDEYFQDSNIVWISHGGRIDNSFLKCFYDVVRWAGIEGSTIQRLYNDNILNTEISLSSVTEQKKIGKFFLELDTLLSLHQCKLEKLQNIKKSCLEKMFV